MDNSKLTNAIINKIEMAIIYELFSKGHINEIEYTEIMKKIDNKKDNDNCENEVIINVMM